MFWWVIEVLGIRSCTGMVHDFRWGHSLWSVLKFWFLFLLMSIPDPLHNIIVSVGFLSIGLYTYYISFSVGGFSAYDEIAIVLFSIYCRYLGWLKPHHILMCAFDGIIFWACCSWCFLGLYPCYLSYLLGSLVLRIQLFLLYFHERFCLIIVILLSLM